MDAKERDEENHARPGTHWGDTVALAIDRGCMLRRWGMFLGYDRNCSRRWFYVDSFRDAVSWNLHAGKFEFIIDRPRREDLR